MRTRFTWIVGVAAVVSIGVLMSCSSKYSASSADNGLVVVSTQGDAVMQTFSFNVSTGHVSQINNSAGPPTPGIATAVVIDPAGAFAYVATEVTCTPSLPANTSLTGAVQGGILTFPIKSDGKLGAASAPTYLTGNPAYSSFVTQGFPTCGLDDATNPNPGNQPAAITMDSSGKYLFVATAPAGVTYTTNLDTTPVSTVVTLNSVGIAVYAVSNGSLSQVAGSPFALPLQPGGPSPSPTALAVTNTVFPTLYAPCSGTPAPTTEALYVTDAVNNFVENFSVSSAGALSFQSQSATKTLPSGVAVDACNRFAYVSNATSNNVSAYTICNSVSLPVCTAADYSLRDVVGSPFPAGSTPGPLVVHPFGGFVYVVDTGQFAVSAFRISSVAGSLTPLSPATVATNSTPTAIAIRGDGNWLFVSNLNAANVSQYAITQASGSLTPTVPITTDNLPWGVAVK
jgi:6-phosphogluconolactonase (cycloisomerase 2 family)